MTTEQQQQSSARDLNDALSELMIQVFRWVALVAAIALGVCLGIYLFVRLVGAGIQHDMQNIWTPPISTTTPT